MNNPRIHLRHIVTLVCAFVWKLRELNGKLKTPHKHFLKNLGSSTLASLHNQSWLEGWALKILFFLRGHSFTIWMDFFKRCRMTRIQVFTLLLLGALLMLRVVEAASAAAFAM